MTIEEVKRCAQDGIAVRGKSERVGIPRSYGGVCWMVDGEPYLPADISPWEGACESWDVNRSEAAAGFATQRLEYSDIWRNPTTDTQPPVSTRFALEELADAFRAGQQQAISALKRELGSDDELAVRVLSIFGLSEMRTKR